MSQLKLTIVGDPTPLKNATRVAERSLRNLSKVTSNVGNSMNKALGAVGLGVGLATLTNGLKNATKAASEDRKSQGLLANALQKTVGATSEAVAGAEAYIKRTQLSSAVLDDELRPALASAVRATGSLTGGQRLLDVALDISAETGKDLTTVQGAMNKAFTGNTASLKKLIPGIQLTENWLSELETAYDGTAEKAANLDPYKRLEIVFADLQETIGNALLPALEEFSAYVVSPEGQANIKQIVDLFVAMGKAISNVIVWLVKNIDVVKAVVAAVLVLKVGWLAAAGIVKLYELGTLKAVTATKALKYALITSGIGAAAVAVGTLAAAWLEADEAQEGYYADPTAASGDFTIADWAEKNKDKLIPDWSDEWLELGYESYGAYLQGMYNADQKEQAKKRKVKAKALEVADEIRKALDQKVDGIKKTAEKFRDSIGVAFGLFGEDENAVFNVDYFKSKLQRMVAAAKGFAQNLARIAKVDPSGSLVNELIAMGPAEGNIAAKALLASGDLKDIVGLRTSLYGTGAQAGAVSAVQGNATYEININKAVISASDIIKEIRLLEKKTGRKYLVGS